MPRSSHLGSNLAVILLKARWQWCLIKCEKPALGSTTRVSTPNVQGGPLQNRDLQLLWMLIIVFISSYIFACKYQPGYIWHWEHPKAPVWQMGIGSQWNLTVPGGFGAKQRLWATGERPSFLSKMTVCAFYSVLARKYLGGCLEKNTLGW